MQSSKPINESRQQWRDYKKSPNCLSFKKHCHLNLATNKNIFVLSRDKLPGWNMISIPDFQWQHLQGWYIIPEITQRKIVASTAEAIVASTKCITNQPYQLPKPQNHRLLTKTCTQAKAIIRNGPAYNIWTRTSVRGKATEAVLVAMFFNIDTSMLHLSQWKFPIQAFCHMAHNVLDGETGDPL